MKHSSVKKWLYMMILTVCIGIDMHASYVVGGLDTTTNGGTGFGQSTPSLAPGYALYSIGLSDVIINACAIQPDGKTVVAGSVSSGYSKIIRYNINGTVDSTFGSLTGVDISGVTLTGMTNIVATGILVQPDGKIVVSGTCIKTAGSVPSYFIVRYTPAGNLDSTGASTAPFTAVGYIVNNIGELINALHATTTSSDQINAIALDADENIVIAGTTTITQSGHGTTQNIAVVRYSSLGVLDSGSFNTGSAVGGTNTAGVLTVPGIALISMSDAVSLACNDLAFDSNGGIVVVGSTSDSTSMFIARFLSAGTLDTTGFNNPSGYNTLDRGGNDIAYAVGFQSDGKIIIAGQAGVFGPGVENVCVARFLTNGLLDSYVNDPTAPFGTGEAGFQTGYINDRDLGGIPSVAYDLTIQADDKIVIGGYATADVGGSDIPNLLIARFVADGSGLDTGNFGQTPANGYTLTAYSSTSNIGNSLAMQENGSFLLAGTVVVLPNNQFITARYLGDIPKGCMDISYNPTIDTSPGTPGFSLSSDWGSSFSDPQPQVTSCVALSDNSIFVITQNIDNSNSSLIQLNSDGQVITSEIVIAQPGAQDVIVDGNGYAVVVGSNGTNGWIGRWIPTTGTPGSPGSFTFDPAFNGGFINVNTGGSLSYSRVGIKINGDIVVMGQQDASTGILALYGSDGIQKAGTQSVGSSVFIDLLIDNDNNQYVTLYSTIDGSMAIYGSNSSFGTGGYVLLGYATPAYSLACMAFDTSQNLVVTMVKTASPVEFVVQTYNSSGTRIRNTSIPFTSLTSPFINRLQVNTNNDLIFAGYNTNNYFMVGKITYTGSTYVVDTTFAPYSPTPGVLQTMYSTNNPTDTLGLSTPYRSCNDLIIAPSGSIVYGGYEYINSSNTLGLVGQVVGDDGIGQNSRFPINFNGTVSGTVNLGTSAPLSNGHPEAIYTFASGTFSGATLVATTDGTDTTLSMLDASTYALNTSFGIVTHGGPSGQIGLAGMVQVDTMMVDVDGNIYVAGSSLTDAIVYKVQPDGSSAVLINIPEATEIAGLTNIYSMAQQASGRILLAGYNSFSDFGTGSGVILSYDPVHDQVDTSFNQSSTPGYKFTGASHPITSISVATDASIADKIYFAYQSAVSVVNVNRLLENGTDLDPTFTPVVAALTPTSDSLISMKLDVDGAIDLVVQTSTGIQAARYNPDGTTGGAYGVAAAVVIPSGLNGTLQEVVPLSDGTTLILAANGSTLNLAQLTSDFVLNDDFNPYGVNPGILTTTVGSQVEFFAVDVLGGAAGIIVTGDTNATANSAVPYLTQIYNDASLTKVSQGATTLGTSGELDVTFNADGNNPGTLNLALELSENMPANTIIKVLLQNNDGSYYAAGDDGTDTYMIFMSPDDVQNTSFGTSGLLTLTSQPYLHAMLLAQDGGFYAVGGSGGVQLGWIEYRDGTSGAAIVGFEPTVVLDAHFSIAQQPEGRLLVAGVLDGVGTVLAYHPLTGAVDTSFGDAGYYTFTDYAEINSLVVDLVGNVYIIANDGFNNATIRCLNPHGTTVYWTEILVPNSTISTNNHLTFNQVVNLVAVGVNNTTKEMVIKSYDLGATGGNVIQNLAINSIVVGIANPRVTSVLVDLNASPGKIILTGYDDQGIDVPFILRTVSAENSLDATFTSGTGTAGIVQTIVPSDGGAQWHTGMINANGKITVAGFNIISSELDPYMMRVYGDEFIGQYDPEVLEPMPDDLDTNFGTDGIAYTSTIANLLQGGSTFVDSQRRVLVGGVTTDNKFVVARFSSAGVLDNTFGTDGIAYTSAIGTLVTSNGAYITCDIDDNVYIGGLTTDLTLIVAKFLGTTGALDTAGFNAGGSYSLPAGITQSVPLSELNNAGYVTIDYLGNVLVGGSTSGFRLSIARFTPAGLQDTTFDTDGTAQVLVNNLGVGGFLATHNIVADADNSVYVSGYLTDSHLVVAKFDNAGQIVSAYGTSGVASTGVISNLAGGGCVALDSNKKAVVGGYTNDKTFVAARFTANGVADTTFDIDGIAISNTLTSLNSNPNLVIDTNDNVVLGGLFTAYDGVSKSMVVARFTREGAIDTSFTSTGIGSTGIITGLLSGGFVAVNGVTNPFVGGYMEENLVIAELYSGSEIIIADPSDLQGGAFNIYWYGNNPDLFRNFFATEFYASVITNATVRLALIDAINTSLDEYVLLYENQPDLNLAASTTPGWDSHFENIQAAFLVAYPASTTEINTFFTDFNNRRTLVRDTLLQVTQGVR